MHLTSLGCVLCIGCCLCIVFLPMMCSSMTAEDKPHVLVVGGGLAGLSAALEAASEGARVTIVDKMKSLGGNSAKATSGMNGCGTTGQVEANVEDSHDIFLKDIRASCDGLGVPELGELLVRDSRDAIEWVSSFGVPLEDVIQLGGHSVARTHREPPRADGKPSPVGFDIVKALKVAVEANEDITVLLFTKATGFIVDDFVVKGIKYDRVSDDGEVLTAASREIKADAVVLAAGGYANDHTSSSLLARHAPRFARLPTTNGPQAQGDGVKMGVAAGATAGGLDKVQVHPTGFVDAKSPYSSVKFLAPEGLRGCGGILLGADGRRFTNELGRRDDVTAAIFKHGTPLADWAARVGYEGVGESPSGDPLTLASAVVPKVAVLVLSDEGEACFGKPATGFYRFKGLLKSFEDAESLASSFGLPAAAVQETLDTMKRVNDGEQEDPFKRSALRNVPDSSSQPLVAAAITPSIHYTMGGLRINADAQVLRENPDAEGESVEGLSVMSRLFAAGEVSWGVHGENRLGGNSLLECAVFGRIAGRNAVAAATGAGTAEKKSVSHDAKEL